MVFRIMLGALGLGLLTVSPDVLAQGQNPETTTNAPEPSRGSAEAPKPDASGTAAATQGAGSSSKPVPAAATPQAPPSAVAPPGDRPAAPIPPPEEAKPVDAPAAAGEANATTGEAVDFWSDHLPRSGDLEIGYFVGFVAPSSTHNFQDESAIHRGIGTGALYGHRLGYFPHEAVGIEVEAWLAPTTTSNAHEATLWAVRGELVGQLPLWRLVPFVLIGAGRMGVLSSTLGNDGDPLFHYGAGAKLALSPVLSARLDLRDNLTQEHGASDGTSTHHLEMSLGITLRIPTLGEPSRQSTGAMPPDGRPPATAVKVSVPPEESAPDPYGLSPSREPAPEPTPPPALDPRD